MENSYQKFAKDVIIIGIFNVLMTFNGLILLPILTKLLGTHDYGIWAQVNATKGLILILAGLGLQSATTRFLATLKNKEDIQEQFYSVLAFESLIAFIICLLLILLAPVIAGAFFNDAVDIVRITGLIGFVWCLDGICLVFFKAFRQMKHFAIFGIASGYLELGVIAYLVLNGHGLLSVVISVFVVEALYFLVLFFYIRSRISWRRPRFTMIREYLALGVPLVPSDFSYWITSLSDRYIIGFFLGAASVGIYSASYGVAMLVFWSSGILIFVLLPTLSRLYDEGKNDEIQVLVSRSLEYFLALALPFLGGAAVLSKAVLGFLTTPEIASEGWTVTPIIALGLTFLGLGMMMGQILIVAKRTRIMGQTWLVAAALSICINIVLVPRIGIIGAACTNLLVYTLASVFIIRHSLKIIELKMEWLFLLKCLAAAVVMSLLIWWLGSFLNVVLTVIAGIVVYAAALVLLKAFSKQRWLFFKGLLSRG